MATSVKRIEQAMISSQTAKNRIAEMKVRLEKRRLDWELSRELYGAGSDATQEERAQFSRVMRRRLLQSLEEDIVVHKVSKLVTLVTSKQWVTHQSPRSYQPLLKIWVQLYQLLCFRFQERSVQLVPSMSLRISRTKI